MSAIFTLQSYSDNALRRAIRSLSFRGQNWPTRLEELLREKRRREIEEKIAAEPSQYETSHRGCAP